MLVGLVTMKLPLDQKAADVAACVQLYRKLLKNKISKVKALTFTCYGHALWTPFRIEKYTDLLINRIVEHK